MAGGFSARMDTRALERTAAELSGRVDDWTPIWPTIGEVIRTSISDTFRAEGRPERWPDLTDFTKEMRRKGTGAGPQVKILQDTGRLFDSITDSSDRDHAELRNTATEFEFGTNVIYAPVHNYGATIRPKKKGGALAFGGVVRKSVRIPARPFAVVLPEDEDEIVATVEDWLQQVVR